VQKNSYLIYIGLAVGLVFSRGVVIASETPISLVPQPKQVKWSSETPVVLNTGKVSIVIGDNPTVPERYAADTLTKLVRKRFGQEWPISSENKVPEESEVLILLGQRHTNQQINHLCVKNKIEWRGGSAGHDGYLIEVLTDAKQKVVLVGGGNPRGVIYAQDTLFQLLSLEKGKLILTRASIRDWPSIPWRGRPQTHFTLYLDPGELDCYMVSRANFIDLRDGIYAFEPGTKLDKEVLSRVINEAHRRGLVVYGTVNCGVSQSRYNAVLSTFKEFIDLGADGVWISFDDKGPGQAPEEIVFKVIELARENGITGSRIAMCPPKGSYQEIETVFMRKMLAIPGMDQPLCFWTCIPSAENLAGYRRMGVRNKPSWWHNWIRLKSGFTHYESKLLHQEGKHSYSEVPALSEGWHSPKYDELTEAGKYIDAVMPWGGQGWGDYYIVPPINWWAWNPEGHDFKELRRRIYNIVYGPDLINTMISFDEQLPQLKSLFTYSWPKWEAVPFCPARLRNVKDRDKTLSLISRLEKTRSVIAQRAYRGTLLTGQNLDKYYLDAMRDELAAAKACATLPYPEYWWQEHQAKVLNAVYDGNLQLANKLTSKARKQLLDDISQIGEQLGHLSNVSGYVDWWTAMSKLDGNGWRALLANRRQDLSRRVWNYDYSTVQISTMLAEADNPPLDWGTGRWLRRNKVLATILPTEREMFWGEWMAGIYKNQENQAAVFAFKPHIYSTAGMFSELEVQVPISGNRDLLALMLFLSNVDKETIGHHYARSRWAGHRSIRLIRDDKTMWEADLGIRREQGEWFMIKLPPIPKDLTTLKLRLRVDELKDTHSAKAIAFVGPIRLIQLPE